MDGCVASPFAIRTIDWRPPIGLRTGVEDNQKREETHHQTKEYSIPGSGGH
jgi:hypothetical protein